MANNHILVLLFAILPLVLHANGTNHKVYGHVTDNITGNGVAARMTLMTVDSIVIDTASAVVSNDKYTGGTYSLYVFNKGVSKKGSYIVKAESKGYSPGYFNFKLNSNREENVHLDDLFLSRDYHDLPEVTVNATKIKMVMHGDTIVYNADAFNLADGSMLDALIGQLPGTKLTKDGKIYVNGRYVESLLVNGQDFFSGNAKAALQNLPAYTVHKIKVYDKAGVASEMMRRDMGDKKYVMDVRLKKEYAQGYMGNMEAGAGTKNRYKLHAFGMKFSSRSRNFAFANINNLNENQSPDLSGNWNPQDIPNGLLATKTFGLTMGRFSSDIVSNWVTSSNIYTHTGADNETRQGRQIFLPGGDSYNNSVSKMISSTDLWESREGIQITKSGFSTTNMANLTYSHKKGWGNGNAEASDSASLLNRALSASSSDMKNIDAEFTTINNIRVFTVDMLSVELNAKYNRLKNKSFSMSDIHYFQNSSSPRDYRDNYADVPHQNVNLSADISYVLRLRELSIRPEYKYSYNYNKTHSMLYRLDKLAGRDSSRFDLLPSARNELLNVLDMNNSYRFREWRNEHQTGINFFSTKNFLNAEIMLKIPLRIVNGNLFYHRNGRQDVSRQATFFEPNFWMQHWGDNVNWRFEGEMKSEIPDMTAMADYRDDSDPLNIALGNPGLKNIHRYSIKGNMSLKGGQQQNLSLWADYHKTDNAVAYGLTFDKQNGISIVQPQSVNGNWDANGGIGYSRALDKEQKFTTDNSLWVNYNHNVDLSTSYSGSYEDGVSQIAPERSIVNNWKVGGSVKFNYRPNDKCEFSLHAKGNYNLINSAREGFDNINAGDYNIGFNTTLSLPWKLQLSTDMTMFARRGYQQSEMNSTDWVWNAQLSRGFFRGKLTAKVQGFDILHELSTTQYLVNEQGRTETWHNSIPRYVMFSLAWRFNHNPKKIETNFY